jgi:hypothetical protein
MLVLIAGAIVFMFVLVGSLASNYNPHDASAQSCHNMAAHARSLYRKATQRTGDQSALLLAEARGCLVAIALLGKSTKETQALERRCTAAIHRTNDAAEATGKPNRSTKISIGEQQ